MENEDAVVPVFTVKAVLKQGGIKPDDIMAARIKRLEEDYLREAAGFVRDFPDDAAALICDLRQIIAYAYQVCGVHDCPDSILDVLAHPTEVTEEQLQAMLPYTAKVAI